VLSICTLRSHAQEVLYRNSQVGVNAGLQLAFGTHVQRIGLCVQFYYLRQHFQANSELRLQYNVRALGPRLKYPELILSQGLVYAWGPTRNYYNPFLGALSNQSNYTNSVAYAYNAYFTRIGTTQQTGQIAIQIKDVSLIAENDLLARPALDRFRTGAFLLQYQYKQFWQAGISSVMWTGQMGHKAATDRLEIRTGCYMDTTGSVYTNVSHGLLQAQFKYAGPYSQVLQVAAGVDAEQVRNAIQNHVFHDMRFIPKKINHSKNCHIPMLDTEGNAYLYKDGQLIRKPRAVFDVGLNQGVFY
jgi:hypothetical protein